VNQPSASEHQGQLGSAPVMEPGISVHCRLDDSRGPHSRLKWNAHRNPKPCPGHRPLGRGIFHSPLNQEVLSWTLAIFEAGRVAD